MSVAATNHRRIHGWLSTTRFQKLSVAGVWREELPVGLWGDPVRKHAVLPDRNRRASDRPRSLVQDWRTQGSRAGQVGDDTKSVPGFWRKKNALRSSCPLKDIRACKAGLDVCPIVLNRCVLERHRKHVGIAVAVNVSKRPVERVILQEKHGMLLRSLTPRVSGERRRREAPT